MVRLNPKDAQAHYRLADHLLLEGELQKAEAHYKSCLQNQPSHVDALYNLGVIYHRTNRNEEAVETFKKLLTIDPKHAQAKKALEHMSP